MDNQDINFWLDTPHTIFQSTEISAGLHNTLIFIVVIYLVYWLSSIFYKVYKYRLFILRKVNTHESVCLKGASLFVDEMILLSRSHFGQIIRQKRVVPPVPVPRVKSAIRINTSSLRVITNKENVWGVRTPNENLPHALCFEFDAYKPCTIQLFWAVPYRSIKKLLTIENEKDITEQQASQRATSRASRLIGNLFTSRRINPNKPPYVEMDDLYPYGLRDLRATEINKADLQPSEYGFKSREYNFPAGLKQLFIPEKEDMILPSSFMEEVINVNLSLAADDITMLGLNENYKFGALILASTKKTRQDNNLLSRSSTTFEANHQITLVGLNEQFECSGILQFLFATGIKMAQQPFEIYGLENSEEMECSICMSNLRDAMLLPCRHCSSCFECIRALHQERCPICRSNFTGFITFPLKNNINTNGYNYTAVDLPNYNEIF